MHLCTGCVLDLRIIGHGVRGCSILAALCPVACHAFVLCWDPRFKASKRVDGPTMGQCTCAFNHQGSNTPLTLSLLTCPSSPSSQPSLLTNGRSDAHQPPSRALAQHHPTPTPAPAQRLYPVPLGHVQEIPRQRAARHLQVRLAAVAQRDGGRSRQVRGSRGGEEARARADVPKLQVQAGECGGEARDEGGEGASAGGEGVRPLGKAAVGAGADYREEVSVPGRACGRPVRLVLWVYATVRRVHATVRRVHATVRRVHASLRRVHATLRPSAVAIAATLRQIPVRCSAGLSRRGRTLLDPHWHEPEGIHPVPARPPPLRLLHAEAAALPRSACDRPRSSRGRR